MSKQWNDNLRRRMEQYEAPAPDSLFDEIMDALPTVVEPTSRPIALWWRRAAVAIAVIATMTTAYLTLITPPPVPRHTISQSIPAIENAYTTDITESSTESVRLADATSAQNVAQASQSATIHISDPTENMATIVSDAESLATQNKTQKKEITQSRDKSAPTQPSRQNPKNTQNRPAQSARTTIHTTYMPKREKRGTIAVSLHATGVAVAKNTLSSQQVFMVNSVLYGGRANNTEEADNILVHDAKHSITSERHHRQPLRVGDMLRYNLSERWALESGITYTKLASNVTQGDSADYYDECTTLHYLGIPLNAVFDLWQTKRFTLYLSAGGMVEKSVSGTTRIDYFVDNSPIHSHKNDTQVKPLQWSTNIAAGIQFNFTPYMAAYAEPSVAYRFDNGTKIETLYNERPFDFNLSVGLRFTLR